MIWLKAHPKVVIAASWEAFEKIIAEVLASKGFTVELTGKAFGQSGDILAIRTDELGIETKYLVECKKYSPRRKVGLNVVNAFVGAAWRAGVDHALLVTTSRFTKGIQARKASLRDVRLHLRDGAAVVEWLRDYEPSETGGMWMAEDWDETT
jgi:restriction endonuclease Mrr